jgi:ferredoxin
MKSGKDSTIIEKQSMKKIIIDREKCLGCGACVFIAPKTFRIDKKGKSKVVSQQGDPKETIHMAIDCCPAKAISYED